MGSMGFLLADWSIELIRSRNSRKKNKKSKKAAADIPPCKDCITLAEQLATHSLTVQALREEREGVTKVLEVEETESEHDLVTLVEKVMKETKALKEEVTELKAERLKMAESIGRQLTDRDNSHEEKIKEIEAVRTEKERQLLQSASLLRQELAAAKKELKMLERNKTGIEEGKLEEEIVSLRKGLDLKKSEVDKLKAEKNSMVLEVERVDKMEVELKLQKQKVEDMTSVIKLKNDQLGQVLDKYDDLQQELEIEVSAHLSCQQELERTLVEKEMVSRENERRWMEVTSTNKKGMILDAVNKEKGLAYRYKL